MSAGSDGGTIDMDGTNPVPNAPPVGVWFHNSYWDNKTSISAGFGFNFTLKCQVTDSGGNTAIDLHSVSASSQPPYKVANIEDNVIELVEIPKTFKLHQNHPNPFNPVTSITFGMPESGNVNISVYSL